MSIIRLYHMGFQVIDKPDIRIGRANADYRETVRIEEENFQREFARILSDDDQ